MVAEVLVFLQTAFTAAVQFFTDIIDAVQGTDFIIFAVSMVLTISLLFSPLRGARMYFDDYKAVKTSERRKKMAANRASKKAGGKGK